MHSSLDLQPPYQLGHKWFPSSGGGPFGTLKLTNGPLNASIYFTAPDQIDAAIAELVALRAEMTAGAAPAVIEVCGCSHGGHLHDSAGCMLKSCGCAKFRPGAAASAPEPPAVVAGEVEPNPPFHVAPGTDDRCRVVHERGFICTAQPDHVAYGRGDHECHRWPVAVAVRIGGNLVPLGGEL